MSSVTEAVDTETLAADWHATLRRYHHTMCALDRALVADHGLSASDFEVLQQLHETDECGVVLMHRLAERVHLSQSALSRLITRLEKAGLVTRGVCEEDRRAAWTQITDEGERRFCEAKPTHRAILAAMAGDA